MTPEEFQADLETGSVEPETPGPVIAEAPKSRFLFVDVAAMRAKQLRRGALPRLGRDTHQPLKAERIAMEEVRKGYVSYDLPDFRSRRNGETAEAAEA